MSLLCRIFGHFFIRESGPFERAVLVCRGCGKVVKT